MLTKHSHKMVIVIYLLIIVIVQVNGIVNPFGPTIVNDYTNCIIHVMEKDFKDPGLLIFGSTDNISITVHPRIRTEILKYIHNDVKYSVQVASRENEEQITCIKEEFTVLHRDYSKIVTAADYFLIVIDNYEDFRHLVNRIIHSHNWNPTAKFIILFFGFIKSTIQINYVERILSCMFSLNVINIVIIVPQEKNIRNAIIYGWRPYDPPKYCGHYNETVKNRLLVENVCEKGKLKYNKSVFENKLPRNMSGCALHILALEKQPFISANPGSPNIEQIFINEIFNQYQMKAEYEIINGSFRGERYDGIWDGALQLLIAKKGHILLGGIFPDFDVHEDFESSTFYLSDSYTWVVPRAYPSPAWVALFIIFKKSVWGCVCLAFIVCVFVWWILAYFDNDTYYNKNLGYCFLNTWISMLGFCSHRCPKKGSSRVFYVFFNLYCMLTLTGYQTKLIDVLRNPTSEYQINSIEELVTSGLKFGGSEDLHDLFKNSSDPTDYLLGAEWTDVDDISKALIDVVVHRNFSLLCSRLQLKQLSATMPELIDDRGNYKYYAFGMNTFTVSLEMVALRGFPFMHIFSDTVTTFRQCGINAAVRRYFDIYNEIRKKNLLRKFVAKYNNLDALTVEHLQGGFLALMFGYVSGFLALIAEISWKSNFVQRKVVLWKQKIAFYKA